MTGVNVSEPITPREAKRMALIQKREMEMAGSLTAVRTRVQTVLEAIKQQDDQSQDHDSRPGFVTISLEASKIVGKARAIGTTDGETVLEGTLKYDTTSGTVASMRATTYSESQKQLVHYAYQAGRAGTTYRVDVRGDKAGGDKHQVLYERPGRPVEFSERGYKWSARDFHLGAAGVGALVGGIATGIAFGLAAWTGAPGWVTIGAGCLGGLIFLGMAGDEPGAAFGLGAGITALGAAGAYLGWYGVAGAAGLGALGLGTLIGMESGRAPKPSYL